MGVARLEHWALDSADGPDEVTLLGTVYGHSIKADGDKVRTSRVVDANGRRVTTASGTVYELGEPHPDYLIWMRGHGIRFDETQPVKIRRAG